MISCNYSGDAHRDHMEGLHRRGTGLQESADVRGEATRAIRRLNFRLYMRERRFRRDGSGHSTGQLSLMPMGVVPLLNEALLVGVDGKLRRRP
jgi:hypothetical protein